MAQQNVQDGTDLVDELAGIPAPSDEGAVEAAADDAPPAEPVADEPLEPEAPAEPGPAPISVEVLHAQLQAQEERAKRLERELEFVRAAQQPVEQPAPQANPLEQIQTALQVNEDDLAELLAGGPRAAQIASVALQRAAALGAQVALTQAAQFYTHDQTTRAQQVAQQQAAQRMHDDFWSGNGDLQAYTPLVQHFAREVAAEQPQRQFDWQTASAEVARRTRAYIATLPGVPTPTTGQPQGMRQGARVRPAFGESGSRGAGARQASTQFEQMFGDLLQ